MEQRFEVNKERRDMVDAYCKALQTGAERSHPSLESMFIEFEMIDARSKAITASTQHPLSVIAAGLASMLRAKDGRI